MALRTAWLAKYLIEKQAAIQTAVNATVGAYGDTGLVLLTNKPPFNSGQNVVDQRKATGQATRRTGTGQEMQLTTRLPNVSWEGDLDVAILAYLLWGVFQNGVGESAGGERQKTMVPYRSLTEDVWYTLVGAIHPAGVAKSLRIIGAMPTNFRVTVADGILKWATDFLGYDFETNRDVASDTLTHSASYFAPLLWQNAYTFMDGNQLLVFGDDFALNFNNNAASKMFSQDPGAVIAAGRTKRFSFGDLIIDGSITIPRESGVGAEDNNAQIDDMISGTVKTIYVSFGNSDETLPDANGEASFLIRARYTGDPSLIGDDEEMVQLPFIGVDLTPLVAGTVATTLSTKNIVGTGTAFTSAHAGDILQITSGADAGYYIIDSITDATNLVLSASSATPGATAGSLTYILYRPAISVAACDSINRGIGTYS